MAALLTLTILLPKSFCLKEKVTKPRELLDGLFSALRRGGEQAFLAEALTTHGKALARLNQAPAARTSLDQAVEISQIAGNPDRGGIAAITAIEELSDYLSTDALQDYYRTAERLLSNSQNLSIKTRLGECARRVLLASLANATATNTSHLPRRTHYLQAFLLTLKYFATKEHSFAERSKSPVAASHELLAFLV